MRRVSAFVLLVILLASGCSLTKKTSSDCAADPSGIGGSGTAVCTKPPPAQFSQLGQ